MAKFFKRLSRRITETAPIGLYVPVTNATNALHGYPHKIEYTADGKLIKVSDSSGVFYICRRNRLWLYKKTIANRLKRLQSAYMLDRIEPGIAGAFIDCGANVGELGAFAKERGLDYHAFEPEQLEADCCDLNNFEGRPVTNRLGLWNEEATLKFYSKPDTGDSSVFEQEGITGVKEIKTTTVDAYCRKMGITDIAVLKIEAEGAEPEILAGAKESLGRARYVTVDCGFERGLAKSSTLVDVANLLLHSGFDLVDWNSGRVTFLFRNSALK